MKNLITPRRLLLLIVAILLSLAPSIGSSTHAGANTAKMRHVAIMAPGQVSVVVIGTAEPVGPAHAPIVLIPVDQMGWEWDESVHAFRATISIPLDLVAAHAETGMAICPDLPRGYCHRYKPGLAMQTLMSIDIDDRYAARLRF